MDINEYLELVKRSSDIELDATRKMFENNMLGSQEVIANIAALGELAGSDPMELLKQALEVANKNPQTGSVS